MGQLRQWAKKKVRLIGRRIGDRFRCYRNVTDENEKLYEERGESFMSIRPEMALLTLKDQESVVNL